MLRVVYIAGPFRAANDWDRFQNINRAETLAFEVWKQGMVALCPHNNTRHFDGTLNDETWLQGDLELLRRSDVVLVTPDWERSSGARAEVAYANEHGTYVAYDMGQLIMWRNQQDLKAYQIEHAHHPHTEPHGQTRS